MVLSIILSIVTSCPSPEAAKYLHTITILPQYLSVGMMFLRSSYTSMDVALHNMDMSVLMGVSKV